MFRQLATIDANAHKGLLALNSITNNNLVVTGLSLTNSQPLHVAVVDGSGTQITSFGDGGGDTQYTSGDVTPANPIGTFPVFDSAGTIEAVSNIQRLPVAQAETALPVNGVLTAAPFALVDGSGNQITSFGGDGAIVDGVNPTIKANVISTGGTYNPLTVSLINSAGNQTDSIGINGVIPVDSYEGSANGTITTIGNTVVVTDNHDFNYGMFDISGSYTGALTVQIAAQGFFEMPTIPVYTGAIFGIWAAANGNVRITELA